MKQDLRFAFRMLVAHRWFSLVVIVTLALGIGINTTVFTLVNAVLFKPVPLPGGSRLVTVSGQVLTQPDQLRNVSYPDFKEYQAQNRSFEGFEAMMRTEGVISEQGNPPERVNLARVTPGLFSMVKTAPVLGRGFLPADGQPGAPAVVLIGHSVWKNRYGADPAIVGRAVRVNMASATIVGVMPAGFKFPQNEDMWIPLVPDAEMESRKNRPLRVFALLKPGVSREAAGADLAVIAQRLAQAFPDTNKEQGVIVRTFHETFNGGEIRKIFLTMLVAVGFVLLIACANVATLLLSRAFGRQRELSVRAALGASRWQLIRQLLVESVLLSVLGGLAGLALSAFGVRAFAAATENVGKPYWIVFEMDYMVYVYFAAVSIASGLLFGLAPALRASRVDLNTALKDGAATGGGRSGGKLIAVLVVLQFALTVVLLSGAGLMMRSFLASQQVNEFIPAERILTARLNLPGGAKDRYAERGPRLQFFDDLLPRLAALPGVTHVAATSNLPALGSGEREIELEGRPLEDPKKGIPVATGVHTPGYPAAIDLPIVHGRGFLPTDGDPGKEAAIVTREFAAKHWPGEPAVGKRFRFLTGNNEKTWIPVVGVSGDLVQRGEADNARPLVFTPLRQEPKVWMVLIVRTTGDPAALAPLVRAAVQQIDQDLPLYDVLTMPAAFERRQWPLKVFGSLFFSFAAIALLLASIGLYGVVAQATGRRTREIGIRIALGATAGRILGLVLSRGLIQLGIGLLLGLAGAFAATQVLAKTPLLFRVSARDPAVFAIVTLLLVLVGLLACWLPARRAARIAPTEALRTE